MQETRWPTSDVRRLCRGSDERRSDAAVEENTMSRLVVGLTIVAKTLILMWYSEIQKSPAETIEE
jgi:hypothetical protein